MTAAFYTGNPMASELRGKALIKEFALSEWRAESLSRYSRQLE